MANKRARERQRKQGRKKKMKERKRNKPRERTTKNVERNKDTKEIQAKGTHEGSNKGEMHTRGQIERIDKQTAVSICVLGMSAFGLRS